MSRLIASTTFLLPSLILRSTAVLIVLRIRLYRYVLVPGIEIEIHVKRNPRDRFDRVGRDRARVGGKAGRQAQAAYSKQQVK